MRVRDRRQLFDPSRQREWLQSHASVPFAFPLGGDRYRVYFGTRNEHNHTQVGYAELSLSGDGAITTVSDDLVLGTGDVGRFDEVGVWPSWVVDGDDQTYLYYNGWFAGENVPYVSTIGLASSDDGGETFSRVSEGPILGRSSDDPYITGGPCVLRENGRWRMWYLSARDFYHTDKGPMYEYQIKYAESSDGIDWDPREGVCIPLRHENETRIARPCVRRVDGEYEMWYSYAIGHGGYRLGYAASSDGYDWTRRDEDVSCDPSASGWDSEMVAYPHVLTHGETRYILYNGNDYGRTGFGIGVISDE